jgi:hypothetical protein
MPIHLKLAVHSLAKRPFHPLIIPPPKPQTARNFKVPEFDFQSAADLLPAEAGKT